MSEQPTQLERLEARLQEVNQELARAAQPLERLCEMNDVPRRQSAAELRSGLARWEAVTRQIPQVLWIGSADEL